MGTVNALSAELTKLLRGYATLTPTRCLHFPSYLGFETIHDFLLNNMLKNPLFLSFPPAGQYQIRFWRWAVDNLERLECPEDCEIDAQLYEHCVSLIPLSSSQTVGVRPPSPSYVSYFWNDSGLSRSATLLESRTTIEAGTTGMKTWLASLVLAQYLISNPELVRSARILELGSGVGFLGVVIATLQVGTAYDGGVLHMTDVNDKVLNRCANNISLPCNQSSKHPSLTCKLLDWMDALDEKQSPSFSSRFREIQPDLVIGADVVYDPSIIPSLIRTIHLALLAGHSVSAIIALTVRNEHTVEQFTEAAKSYLIVEEIESNLDNWHDFWGIPQEAVIDSACEQPVRILRLRIHDQQMQNREPNVR